VERVSSLKRSPLIREPEMPVSGSRGRLFRKYQFSAAFH